MRIPLSAVLVAMLPSIALAQGASDLEVKIHGLLQLDGHFYVGDPAGLGLNDTFVFRRVEPVIEATLGTLVYFRLQPQFAGDSASTADAYGELRFTPAFAVRAGKFKEPIVLENLQPSGAIEFIERGLPTELGANRDLGVQLQGELPGATATWAVGVFNGTADGRDSLASDIDSRKEVAARVFVEPFRSTAGFWQGLGLGLSGSTGTKLTVLKGNLATDTANFNAALPRYRSPGQNTIFSYRIATTGTPTSADTVTAEGSHTRYSPQLYFYRGSFGLLGEYISSKQEVSLAGSVSAFQNRAWQGLASYVLTGEDAGYKGFKPARPWNPGGEGWGALEVALRFGVLDVDDAAFPVYADPAKSVSVARDTGVDLNWALTANARLSLAYDVTNFKGGAAVGDRDHEQALFTRVQISF